MATFILFESLDFTAQ